MFRWADFEAAAPELAALGRERIDRHGFLLLGTVRSDGTARISPVGVRIHDGHLAFNLVRPSTKLSDVRRDQRILLHSPVLHADDPNDEFKLRGRAVEIEDEELRQAVALWDAPPEFVAFSIDIENAAFLSWSKGELSVTRWRRDS